MILPKHEAELFFKLMWSLQAFVNRKLKLIPNCSTMQDYQGLETEQKLPVREALYKDIRLIQDFMQENPEHLSDDELAIVQEWQHFVAGEFFIERYLAKHAIFIKDRSVYAVVGLYEPFDIIIPRGYLPMYVKAILLPFKGKIVYDGLLHHYSVFFGRGIRSDLKETYLTAKQNGRILESLEPQQPLNKSKQPAKPAKDWRPKVEALRHEAQHLHASAGSPPLHGAVFSIVKASLELAQIALEPDKDKEQLWKAAQKVDRALQKVFVTLERLDY